ncbi:hypothetical protein [Desulfitobacterium dehalogenans]|uniref:hypothetical protein n=1 Tax=Desulfitobacterium dehalogenans TaxID=36854 RepID=UPI0002497463|nr:hypothetical protein [Desulfitobacterium dehalogenans]
MSIKRRLLVAGIATVLQTGISVYLSTLLHLLLKTKSLRFMDSGFPSFMSCIESIASVKSHLMLFLCFEGFILLFAVFLIVSTNKPYQSRMMQVTPAIETPVAAGQKQHGSARWMTEKEKTETFGVASIPLKDPIISELIKRGKEDKII